MGLLFGSLLKGAGEGAEKGIMIDERQRAEAAAASDRFAQMDYAARKGEEAKAAEQARRDKRLSEFKGEADQWRKENPKASLTDFVSHFAGTQYGDLLQPMVQAANLEGAEKERALRMLSIQAQDRRSAAADARAARGKSGRPYGTPSRCGDCRTKRPARRKPRTGSSVKKACSRDISGPRRMTPRGKLRTTRLWSRNTA